MGSRKIEAPQINNTYTKMHLLSNFLPAIISLVVFVSGKARNYQKHKSSPVCEGFPFDYDDYNYFNNYSEYDYNPSQNKPKIPGTFRHERSVPIPVQNGIKFNVDNVQLGKALENQSNSDYRRVWGQLGEFEQSSALPDDTVALDFADKNMFVESAFQAYKNHFPLKISPDLIWMTIMQGFAQHINKTPEKFRKYFVSHEGKKKIEISRDFWRKGDDNDWEGTFPEFSDIIEKNLKDPSMRKTIEADFSTTGTIDKIVSQIALMDTVQNYFEYRTGISCGIPSIELSGTLKDWKKLRAKAKKLLKPQFDVEFWTKHLFPILDSFVDTFKQPEVNTEFWSSIIAHHKRHAMCGEKSDDDGKIAHLTGWIQDFFPYFRNERVNNKLGSWKKYNEDQSSHNIGMKLSQVPLGISSVPFEWETGPDGKMDMKFIGAITAVVQDKNTLQLEAKTGWGVLHTR